MRIISAAVAVASAVSEPASCTEAVTVGDEGTAAVGKSASRTDGDSIDAVTDSDSRDQILAERFKCEMLWKFLWVAFEIHLIGEYNYYQDHTMQLKIKTGWSEGGE